MTRDRLDPETRKAAILAEAVKLAQKIGYTHITRDEVAARASVAIGLVTYYFKNMGCLKEEVMGEAIRLEIPEIVLQGLAAKCPVAQGAPLRLKARAVEQYSTTVCL